MLTEDITSVVVDIGSLNARAGYSGEDTPRIVMSSRVGSAPNSMDIEDQYKYHIGDTQLGLTKNRENMKIIDVVSKGII